MKRVKTERISLILALAVSLLTGQVMAAESRTGAATPALTAVSLLLFDEEESGTGSYPVRYLVNDAFLRIDDGHAASDYILLDRASATIHSISHEHGNVLIIHRQPQPAVPASLRLTHEQVPNTEAPAISGKQPQHYRYLSNGELCYEAMVVPGLMQAAVDGLAEYERLLAGQQAAFEKQQREIAHIHSYVERFRAKATKARQAQSRLKALARLEQIAPAHIDSPFQFSFRAPHKNPNPLLRLTDAAAGYGESRVLQQLNLNLAPGDRIGLLGPNGAGKSTLIKLLAGELLPLVGNWLPAQELCLGYFAQHQIDQLDLEQSPLDHLARLDSQSREQSLRDYLGGFGFSGERVECPVAPFSGGEKARLVLALLIHRRPNLLLLDEPTNHLDLEMRHRLSQALQDFQGAMVIVSHDRHLLRTTTDRLLLVNNGRVDEFKDDLDAYPRWLKQNRADLDTKAIAAAPAQHSASVRKERKRQQAEQRRSIQPLRDRLRRLDQELASLNEKNEELEIELARPELYDDANKHRLRALISAKRELDQRLAATEEAWLSVGEELEAAQHD